MITYEIIDIMKIYDDYEDIPGYQHTDVGYFTFTCMDTVVDLKMPMSEGEEFKTRWFTGYDGSEILLAFLDSDFNVYMSIYYEDLVYFPTLDDLTLCYNISYTEDANGYYFTNEGRERAEDIPENNIKIHFTGSETVLDLNDVQKNILDLLIKKYDTLNPETIDELKKLINEVGD